MQATKKKSFLSLPFHLFICQLPVRIYIRRRRWRRERRTRQQRSKSQRFLVSAIPLCMSSEENGRRKSGIMIRPPDIPAQDKRKVQFMYRRIENNEYSAGRARCLMNDFNFLQLMNGLIFLSPIYPPLALYTSNTFVGHSSSARRSSSWPPNR